MGQEVKEVNGDALTVQTVQPQSRQSSSNFSKTEVFGDPAVIWTRNGKAVKSEDIFKSVGYEFPNYYWCQDPKTITIHFELPEQGGKDERGGGEHGGSDECGQNEHGKDRKPDFVWSGKHVDLKMATKMTEDERGIKRLRSVLSIKH